MIILFRLSGCPPFFSQNGQPISPGMKSKIRAGKYDFPDAQWKYVSKSGRYGIYLNGTEFVLINCTLADAFTYSLIT